MKPRVTAPTFEHHEQALGIGETRPRLSWTTMAAPGWAQQSYEVETSRDGRTRRSGRIVSSDQILVPWTDDPLASGDAATVRVRVWGGDDTVSRWSPPSTVEVGLLNPDDWIAVGIAADWDEDTGIDNPPPLLRGLFEVDGEVASARLYVTAHGLVEIEINGRKAGDQTLLPGWSVYGSRLRVAAVDVTGLLVAGANAWGAWLGDGWYRGRFGFERGGMRNLYGDRLALLAQLEISYVDGRRHRVGTDGSWRAALGPIALGSLYDGERFDARRLDADWSSAGYDDSEWSAVRVVDFDLDTLTSFDGPLVRCTQEVSPIEVTELDGGRMLLDFGQNLVGRLQISVRGPAGHVIRLLHAEVLQDGELYRRPLRGAAAIDQYMLAGLPHGETWEPRFTIHGFRYAEVDGWTGDPIGTAVVARVYHSDMRRIGWFETSNPLVNRLHENILQSMRGNFVDLPTDCPQRDERLGWTGDIQVFAPTASFLYDTSGFLISWLKDLEAEQLPDGTVPWYVPVIPGGEMWDADPPGGSLGRTRLC